ncbi:DNA repair protein RecO [Candidatus Uhrbacteria bacterium RIFCSPLOWO2_01_FULL_47_24]|uniref:DNA repair protein RecO n=1 Tax=Candidatus Uhrbacteria bacterium RIFCSPLOWO2_01_FULL_47_24 TaxID=1802401 RepID=A0A1F7UTQ5_9BACT|nr:MAG: DNA repair protein RecO [Candidatus Uhrbacteria bacterium RIFCSPHIGHO2_01_FULL_47_11]OGL68952.1 MAG: DNA repair protein RecO [Candidatus Uhrbacteria bacterium RIFCSPHIGHO2_02_FULL_46_47]OGL81672.1 MAG: DNA repair protein RecO [Candidatus Uhrbacteria bacterium RIFCSPLOWO2_01_FULL_47_24]OGL85074.1 MAG: DNA repair protein RecO [Candidatus Uhrbacteria bacterium RIFCSPLOWO2_02_FULL_46_25]
MTYNTEGIILKYRDIGEHERIYTILTREHGKIEGWAQGVRKSQSKLVAHLQPLYFCDFMFARGKRFDRVAQVKVLNRFPELWADLEKLSKAVYVAALVDLVLRPGTREGTVFNLLQTTLQVISSEPSPGLQPSSPEGVEDGPSERRPRGGQGEGILTLFSLKLLKESGFSPELHYCVLCKKEVQGLSLSFDAIRGGVLCTDCFIKASPEALQISSLTIETLESILTAPIARLEMPEAVRRELSIIADAMIAAHFGEEPKARNFMVSLADELPQMARV